MSSRNNLRKALKKLFPWLVVALVAYLFWGALSDSWGVLTEVNIATYVPVAATSIVFFVAAVAWSGALWGQLVERLAGKKLALAESIRVHSLSWLLKYVPGQVGSVTNKVKWAHDRGIDKKAVLNSFLYENVFLVLASLVTSLPLLFALGDVERAGTYVVISCLGLLGLLVVTSRPVVRWMLRVLTKAYKKLDPKSLKILSSKQVLGYTMRYVVPRVLTGVAFLFVVWPLYQFSVFEGVFFAAAYVFASIVGLLAIFVPSGLGVREGVLVVLTTQYVGAELALLLALLARFFATIADVGVLGVYLFMKRRSHTWQ